MVEIFLVVFLVIFVVSITYYIYHQDRKFWDIQQRHLVDLFTQVSDTNQKFYETVSAMQISHFNNLEKQSSKQLALLEKQAKDFLKEINNSQQLLANIPKQSTTDMDKVMELLEGRDKPIPVTPNDIEKADEEEIPLDQMSRIPIVDGVSLKFEDETDIYPMNIEGLGGINGTN